MSKATPESVTSAPSTSHRRSVRRIAGGTVGLLAAAFDDWDPNSTWEAHAIDRYAANLSAGPHIFTVEPSLSAGRL